MSKRRKRYRRPVGPGWLRESNNAVGLFRRALDEAVRGMVADDVALLIQARRDFARVPWPVGVAIRPIADYFQSTAVAQQGVWTVSGKLKDRIRHELDRHNDSEARKQFVTALAIDRAYQGRVTEADRRWQAEQHRVMAPSPAFFGSLPVDHLPPEIGRTSALAAARPFFTTFWHIADLRGVDAFGAIPRPLPVYAENGFGRLETAASKGELVIGLVSWRSHAQANLKLSRGQGWFTVDGVAPPAPSGMVAQLLDRLVEAKIDIALLPELMLEPADEATLCTTLAERLPNYPSFLIAGRTHQRSGGRFKNEAIVVDSAGTIVFAYEKIEPYYEPELGLLEHILPRQSGDYPFLDTPVGRLVVNICRDIGSDPVMLLNRAIEATFLAVPTYTRQLDFIAAEARGLGARQKAITMTVNPTAVAGIDDAAYVYVPARGRQLQASDQRALAVFKGEAWHLQTANEATALATIHPFRLTQVGGVPTVTALAPLSV